MATKKKKYRYRYNLIFFFLITYIQPKLHFLKNDLPAVVIEQQFFCVM